MKKLLFLIFSIMIFLFAACGTTYYLKYDYYLEDSKDKSLHFEDDKFAFDFAPFYNGIYFTITNKTENFATLKWDKCYFIEPNGNSYKAINPDVLNEPTETILKSNYESILPQKSKFTRFTTPSINIGKVTYTYFNQLNTYWLGNQFSYDFTNIQKFNIAGNYLSHKVKEGGKNSATELKKVSDNVKNNNNLGIGFAITHNDKALEYKFNLKVDKISAIYIISTIGESSTKEVLKIRYESENNNKWEWKVVEKIFKESYK